MYNSLDVAARIKCHAKANDIVIKTMMAELGLGSNTMSSMRHGKNIASDSLARIADYLNCSVDYLLGRTDNPGIASGGSIVNNAPVSSGNTGPNAGTINVQDGERVLSDECAELMRIYESLDVRQRIQLLTSAFEMADGGAAKSG